MEKTGELEKLKNDFDDSKNLEVYLPKLDNWYRVTCKDFRSFDGERRINGDKYEGPLYVYGTNRLTPFNNDSIIIPSEILNERKLISKRRGI